MRGGLLHVSQGNPGVEGGGDEGVTQGVGPHPLGDAGPSGQASHDAPGGVAVEAGTVGPEEDGPLHALTDGQVDGSRRAGSEGDGNHLGALAADGEGAMPTLQAQRHDVSADGLRHPQAVECQQRHQGVVTR